MSRYVYGSLMKGLGMTSDKQQLPPMTRDRKTRSPYGLIKKAVKKAKVKHELKEQQKALAERMVQLQSFHDKSEEFLTKMKPESGGSITDSDSDDDSSLPLSRSEVIAADCGGRQYTTKPKVINGELKFTTPKRYLPKRYNSGLAALDESNQSLIIEVPEFEDQSAVSKEEKAANDVEALYAAIVAAGLQDQAAAILLKCQQQAAAIAPQ